MAAEDAEDSEVQVVPDRMKAKLPEGESTYRAAMAEMLKARPNIASATRLLQKSFRRGNPRAAYALGTWYLHGAHVSRDMRKAIELLRTAAKGDVPDALYDLAICYENGTGVAKNLRIALELYVRAALNGEQQSVYEVGRCYFYGIGIPSDRRMAKLWLDRARALGVTASTGGG